MYSLFGFFMGMPGPFELVIISQFVLLLFGKRLPNVMGSLGRSVVEFKKGISGIEDEVHKTNREIEGAVERQKEKEAAKK